MALRDIGADFEHWKVVEFDKYPIASYNAIHGTNFPTIDITKFRGWDLDLKDLDQFTYLLTPFLVRISQLPESRKAWKKEVVREADFFGKLKGSLMNHF